MAVDAEEKEPIPSVKDLASSDPSLRRKNLQQIISYLELRPASQPLSHTQALKLWRGFHVALYMHDSKNQLSVQALVSTLAGTFDLVRAKDIELAAATTTTGANEDDNNDNEEFTGFDDDEDKDSPKSSPSPTSWLSTFSSAFWETIAREWTGIDQWRINKYLLLTRFVLRKIFEISLSAHFGGSTTSNTDLSSVTQIIPGKLSSSSRKRKSDAPTTTATTYSSSSNKKAKTTSSVTSSTGSTTSSDKEKKDSTVLPTQLDILAQQPLSPRSRAVSDGLRLHVLDIYVDELFLAFDLLPTTGRDDMVIKTPTEGGGAADDVMRPVRGVAEAALARHVRARAKEVLAEFGERVGTTTITSATVKKNGD